MGAIRFILAASVVMEHCRSYFGFMLYPGNMAVEMFFMISGFYMGMVLSSRYRTVTWNDRFRFYCSRFWRLWPTFIITSVFVGIWWLIAFAVLGREPTSAGDFKTLVGSELIRLMVLFSNVFMIGQDIPSLFHVSEASGVHFTLGPPEPLPDGSLWMGSMRAIGPAWSIGTEIWFYLLAPFLVRLPGSVLVLLIAGSLGLRAVLDHQGYVVYFFFPAQVALFLVGVLAQRGSGWMASQAIGIAGVSTVLAASLVFGSVGALDQTYKWVLYLAFAVAMPAIFALGQNAKLDRSVGELSYPIYLTHMALLAVLIPVGKRMGVTIGGEALLAVTIAVSWFLYVWVDRPVSRWRQRFVR